MNLSKYIGKTFPAGKTIKEIGIDTSRKFVVVMSDNAFYAGDILVSINSELPVFKRLSDGKEDACFPSQLAYLDEEDDEDYHKNVQNYYDNKVAEYLAGTPRKLADGEIKPGGIVYVDEVRDSYEKAPVTSNGYNLSMNNALGPIGRDGSKPQYKRPTDEEIRGICTSFSKKPYAPRLGDKVRKEGVITCVSENGGCAVGFCDDIEVWFGPEETSNLTLISRASRTLTKAEAEKMLSEKLGEEVSIE